MTQPASQTKGKQESVGPARLAAFQILQRVEAGGYASILLASREDHLQPKDRALCHELVMGVLRFQLWLDRAIEHFAERPVARLDLPVTLALRLGLYQLRFLTRIPQAAAVNESVKLVRRARLRSAKAFTNAVLRRATREPEFDPVAGIKDPIERLAVLTSHPSWLLERWVAAFGFEEAEAFASANNQIAPLAFRIVRRHQAEALISRLEDAGATLTPSQIAKDAWRFQGNPQLAQELAASGVIYFQDEASQLVGQVLDARPGERVLDVCAAPGSKTTQVAATGELEVVAGDIHLHRLQTVRQAAFAQHLRNVKCVAFDAQSELPFAGQSFDRVLVDAPCSGTGTLRHNPEIRWRISAGDIEELSDRQRRMLRNAAVVVKPSGRLVYSTCSIEPEENEAVVQEFLKSNPDFQPSKINLRESLQTSENTARTWPHRDNVDGFFIAAFERNGLP